MKLVPYEVKTGGSVDQAHAIAFTGKSIQRDSHESPSHSNPVAHSNVHASPPTHPTSNVYPVVTGGTSLLHAIVFAGRLIQYAGGTTQFPFTNSVPTGHAHVES